MFWDPYFQQISDLAYVPVDQVKVIFALLLAFPLASLFVRIPSKHPNVAHLYSLSISFFYFFVLLGLRWGCLHLLVACTGTYIITVAFTGTKMPWIAFWFVMGHLFINHVRRTLEAVPSSVFEITFSQMVLAMKLIMFAWNVHDGRRKVEAGPLKKSDRALVDVDQDLDDTQRVTRLQHIPSPLAYFGYCFFFPSVLIGPSFDYSSYDALVHHTIYVKPPPGVSTQQAKTNKRMPHGRKRIAYSHLAVGLLFLAVYGLYGGRGSYSRIVSPDWYTWNKRTRFAFVQFAGFMARTKYYGVWSMSEGACILTGIGFNGYDPKTGKTMWNRVKMIDIGAIETAESFKVLFDSWNCQTNVWLRECVYKRLVRKGKKPGFKQSLATFLTSAVWHGVDPGYYIAFITAGVMTSIGRQLRHLVRPYFIPAAKGSPTSSKAAPSTTVAKRAYDLVGWFMVQINLNYVASAFVLLNFKDCITAFNRMGWYAHVLVAGTMLFFQAGGQRWLRKGLEKRGLASRHVPSVKVEPPSPTKSIKTSGEEKHSIHRSSSGSSSSNGTAAVVEEVFSSPAADKGPTIPPKSAQ